MMPSDAQTLAVYQLLQAMKAAEAQLELLDPSYCSKVDDEVCELSHVLMPPINMYSTFSSLPKHESMPLSNPPAKGGVDKTRIATVWKKQVRGEHYRAVGETMDAFYHNIPILGYIFAADSKLERVSVDTIIATNFFTGCKEVFKLLNKSIFDGALPRSTLRDSAFLDIYDSYCRNDVNKARIREALSSKLRSRLDNEMRDVHDIKQICVWLWSLGSSTSGLYKDINRALYDDDRKEIRRYIPIISGLNQYLVRKVRISKVTWRGSKMSDEQFREYQIGKTYRCPAIGATSMDMSVALSFKEKVLIKFIIEAGTWNAADISRYSKYAEQEVVLPPYTAFTVLDITNSNITVKVLDNKKVSLTVPSVFI